MRSILFSAMTIEYSRDDWRTKVRVSPSTPLPVRDTKQFVDTLLVGTTTVTTTTNRDLMENTNAETPTLDNCGQYRKLVWFYFRAGGATTTYRILARAADLSGLPLGAGWQQLAQATLPGGANSWGRIEIPSAGDGNYDQYRIEVHRTDGANYTLTSKLVGVR
jgi:hypothetical protein